MSSKNKGRNTFVAPKATTITTAPEVKEDPKAEDLTGTGVDITEDTIAAEALANEDINTTSTDEQDESEQTGDADADLSDSVVDEVIEDEIGNSSESKSSDDTNANSAEEAPVNLDKSDESASEDSHEDASEGASTAAAQSDTPITTEAPIIQPDVIAPVVDVIAPEVIAPPAEVAVQSYNVLPPYLARQRGYLDDYARVMGKHNRPSSQEMAVQQRNLYQVLIMLFDLDGSDFITALDDLLQFINEHRGFMFADKYIFRVMDMITVDQTGAQVFKQIMILLVKIADPQDRALIRNHLDLNTAVRGVRNGERALALITEFLNI